MIYLDNSATTRPTEYVADAVRESMLEGFYNPSALYAPALTSEKQMAACREAIARELHADARNVIFTSGGTEADNLAVKGLYWTAGMPIPGAPGSWSPALSTMPCWTPLSGWKSMRALFPCGFRWTATG